MRLQDLFECEFGDSAEDRLQIAKYLLEFLRSGVASPDLDLRSGRLRLDRGREPIDQCAWKWSEVTGKYVGCAYWSVEAARSFLDFRSGALQTSLWKAGRSAAKRRRGARQLQHDHVFPRRNWFDLMSPLVGDEYRLRDCDIRNSLEHYCIGCVVTREEHGRLNCEEGDQINPWRRYARAGVRLINNPEWPDQHRRWIHEAMVETRQSLE